MNFVNLLQEIENIDPEITQRLHPRRSAIKNITSFGSKVTLAALPFALGTLFQKAYGATALPTAIADVFNIALTLEYLEFSYYTKGISTPKLIPADDLPSIQRILADESNHITFLKTLLGTQALPVPTFDYTGNGNGGGPITDTFTLYASFIKVAQAFEDTGLRTYQGIFPTLLGNQQFLTAAFNIHSVESSHSAHIHQLNLKLGNYPLTPWIVSSDYRNGLYNPELYPVYTDEENSVQLGVPTSSEAFDEPLQPKDAKNLINVFILSPKLV